MSDLSVLRHCSTAEGEAMALALGDTPETVFAAQLVSRGLCRASLLGDSARFSAAMIEVFPGQVLGFGEETRALWELLRRIPAWTSVGVAARHAADLRAAIEQETRRTMRAQTVEFSVLTIPVTAVDHPDVRLLDVGEVDLLLTGPGGSVGRAYGSPQALLTEGVVAGAIHQRELVARAHTSCHSPHYADVAIATREGWRGRGLATAAASLACERVQQQGRTPIWSTTADNHASRRVATKLGFVTWSQVIYLRFVDADDGRRGKRAL